MDLLLRQHRKGTSVWHWNDKVTFEVDPDKRESFCRVEDRTMKFSKDKPHCRCRWGGIKATMYTRGRVPVSGIWHIWSRLARKVPARPKKGQGHSAAGHMASFLGFCCTGTPFERLWLLLKMLGDKSGKWYFWNYISQRLLRRHVPRFVIPTKSTFTTNTKQNQTTVRNQHRYTPTHK